MAVTKRFAITPVSTLPQPKSAGVYLPVLGNCVEVVGHLTGGGTGTATLLKWIDESAAGVGGWYRYRHPIPVDSATNGGQFEGMWMIDKCPEYYAVLLSPGLTADECFLQGTEI